MDQPKEQFGMRLELALDYDEAVARVTNALKEEGFGVLTEIDVKATMKEKLDLDFRRYTILGACNPPLAHRALSTEMEIGLLLPCNVIVYESDEGSGSIVSIVDPIAMLGVAVNPALEDVAGEAQARLTRVAKALSD